MKHFFRIAALVMIVGLVYLPAWAQDEKGQFSIRGRIVDKESGEGLIGVAVIVRDTRAGALTDLDGNFLLENIPFGPLSLDISYLGYLSQTIPVDVGTNLEIDLGTIEMVTDEIGIEEVQVIASYSDRFSPVAVTTFDQAQLRERNNPSLDFPELVRFSPSTYVSRAGGGYGDSRISIRGFDQENLAVLLNGVPVNDIEFGNIFWVNWAGLSDVTRTIQIQRGLGVSKLAINSVGGTMNIITKTTDQKAGGKVSFETTSPLTQGGGSFSPYLYRTSFSLSSGLLPGGWAVSFQGSRVSGNGYFDEQFVDFYSYFLSVTKQLGPRHLLVFTAVGAPQRHGENGTPLTDSTWKAYGKQHNPNWGRLNGEVKSNQNFYHKPQISLNHYWTINDQTSLNTSAYYSYGTGGGQFTIGGPRTSEGIYDYDLMYSINRSGLDDVTLTGGVQKTGYAADFWLTNFRLDQFWVGGISTLDYRPGGNFEFIGGVDLRYFEGDQFFEVDDLLGADFVVDRSSVRDTVRAVGVGDQIFQSKISQVGWYGGFGQVEYTAGPVKAFLSASYVYNTYKRQDRFLYQEGEGNVSPRVDISTFSIKGGARHSFNTMHSIFINGGYFTRAPFFGVVFGNDNIPEEPTVNEKILSGEVGYEVRLRDFRFTINSYITVYKDKTLNIERYVNPITLQEGSALISDLQGRHVGIEGEATWFPYRWLSVGTFFSLGDWAFINDANGVLLDASRQTIGEATLYYDGLFVGNSAQSNLGFETTFRYSNKLFTKISGIYNGKLYAEVGNRIDPSDGAQPYKLPSYYLVDVNSGYDFSFTDKIKGEFRLSINNLFDRYYYSQGSDAVTHTAADTGLFVGVGRTFSLGFAITW